MKRDDITSLQVSPYSSDGGNLIGRDPRELNAEDWRQLRSDFPIGLRAIRAKCLDCVYTPAEVRRCVCVDCPLWPFRMGSVPKGYREAASGICNAED